MTHVDYGDPGPDMCARCGHRRDLHGNVELFGCYAQPCAQRWRFWFHLRSWCPAFVPHEAKPTPPDPDRTQWVRYAADCAERVVHLAGEYRPQAEAAIRAARAWADDPTEKRLLECGKADSDARVFDSSDCAATAADAAAYAARTAIDPAASLEARGKAAEAAAKAAAATEYEKERAWQKERRRFYGLSEADRQVK